MLVQFGKNPSHIKLYKVKCMYLTMLQVVIESYIAKCGDDVINTQISTCIHIEDDMINATKLLW